MFAGLAGATVTVSDGLRLELEVTPPIGPLLRLLADHDPADLTSRLDLAASRRSLTSYAVGLAAYALVVVALYPAFKNSSSLDKLIHADPAAAALFGVTGSISSAGGWLDGNLYADFLPLILLLFTVGYGAASLAGQDEDGTLCLLTVLPVRRPAIVTQKIAALAAQAAVLAAATGACVIIGRPFQLDVTADNVAGISLAAFLMALDFGIIAMAAGALTGRRGTALGAGSAPVAASYLINSLALVVSWLSPARHASLMYWSVGNSQITRRVSAADDAVLLVTGLSACGAAVLAFRRLDVS